METVVLESSESSKLTKIVQSIASSEEVKEMVEKEFEELVLWISRLESKVKETVEANPKYELEQFSNLTFSNVVQSLLTMLDKREMA